MCRMLVLVALAAVSPALDLKPCRVENLPARCGVAEVPENRSLAGGRRIPLNLIVVPARETRGGAIFVLHGGPAFSNPRMILKAAAVSNTR